MNNHICPIHPGRGTSLHVKYRQKKTQTNSITQSPDTNISESTWEYKITNNISKYTCKKENCSLNSDLLMKEFT